MNQPSQLVEFQTNRGEPYVTSKRLDGPPIRFLKLCREHYFCLSQIAQELEISPTTLRKAFSNYAGISPKTWMHTIPYTTKILCIVIYLLLIPYINSTYIIVSIMCWLLVIVLLGIPKYHMIGFKEMLFILLIS